MERSINYKPILEYYQPETAMKSIINKNIHRKDRLCVEKNSIGFKNLNLNDATIAPTHPVIYASNICNYHQNAINSYSNLKLWDFVYPARLYGALRLSKKIRSISWYKENIGYLSRIWKFR